MSDRNTFTTEGVGVACVGARFGVKGNDAAALLQNQGLRIPARPNCVTHWLAHEPFGSGRCLRQGSSEFLIELDATGFPALPGHQDFPDSWMLIRCDHSLLLNGAHWPRELSQLCSFDFTRLQDEPDLVVMTLLAGIGVTLIREPPNATAEPAGMALRLWCDASFSLYLQQCLHYIGGSR